MGIFDDIVASAQTLKKGNRIIKFKPGRYIVKLVDAKVAESEKMKAMNKDPEFISGRFEILAVEEGDGHAVGDVITWSGYEAKRSQVAARMIMGCLGIEKEDCTPEVAEQFFNGDFNGVPVKFYNYPDSFEQKVNDKPVYDENGEPVVIKYTVINCDRPLTKAEVKKLKLDIDKNILEMLD